MQCVHPANAISKSLTALREFVYNSTEDASPTVNIPISEMKKAIELDGVEVMGYTPWSAIDIVSASTGELAKRYGFIYVDLDDQAKGSGRRYRKASFEWYKRVISSNGEIL